MALLNFYASEILSITPTHSYVGDRLWVVTPLMVSCMLITCNDPPAEYPYTNSNLDNRKIWQEIDAVIADVSGYLYFKHEEQWTTKQFHKNNFCLLLSLFFSVLINNQIELDSGLLNPIKFYLVYWLNY